MDQVEKIYSKGIYHGLPVLPDDMVELTAIVAGTSGISGDHMVSRKGLSKVNVALGRA